MSSRWFPVFSRGLFELKPAKREVGGGMGFPSDNQLYDIRRRCPASSVFRDAWVAKVRCGKETAEDGRMPVTSWY